MKVKVIGKTLIEKKDTKQKWVQFDCVTDMKCSNKGGPTYGGTQVHKFMLDYSQDLEQILVGKEYECIMSETLYKGALQSRIVGLV